MASKSSKPSDAKGNSIVPFTNLAATPSMDSMEKIMNDSKDQFEKMKTDATSSGRQGFEAMMKSGTLMAQGLEKYIKTIVGMAQASAERQGEAFKQLLACKTLNEMTEAQNKIAQDNFEELMQSATKLSEMGIKMATEVFEPINSEVSKNAYKAADAAAAAA